MYLFEVGVSFLRQNSSLLFYNDYLLYSSNVLKVKKKIFLPTVDNYFTLEMDPNTDIT